MIHKRGLKRAKQIFLYSDSEPNEVLIGILHMAILPFAMFELGGRLSAFKTVYTDSGALVERERGSSVLPSNIMF